MKSHYIDWKETDKTKAEKRNNERRQHQAEMVGEIVEQKTRPNSLYIILGDMNDPEDSIYLKGFIQKNELKLENGLKNPKEKCLDVRDPELPSYVKWTYRLKKSGQPAEYFLYDQIWLSAALARKQTEAWIDRRTTLGGDGSDHDLAWIKLNI